MNVSRILLLTAAIGLLIGCSSAVESGLYSVQGGSDRVNVDSLEKTKALMSRDTNSFWAETVTMDLKAEKPTLKSYDAPEHSVSGSGTYISGMIIFETVTPAVETG